MNPVFVVVTAIGVVLLAAVVTWRARARERRRRRDPARAPERRLVTPPPSPYQSTRGFRLVDAEAEPSARPLAQRPRLEANRTYVFGETLPPEDDVVNSDARHSNDWFLSRSAHRTSLSLFARRLIVIVVLALVLAVVVTYYVDHRSARAPSSGAPRALAVADSFLVAPARGVRAPGRTDSDTGGVSQRVESSAWGVDGVVPQTRRTPSLPRATDAVRATTHRVDVTARDGVRVVRR